MTRPIFCCSFLSFICITTGMVLLAHPLDDLIKKVKRAFDACNSDNMAGLNWQEVEQCEEKYADVFAGFLMTLPSRKQFKAADLNGDGTLVFEEGEEWIKNLFLHQ
eukprot:GFUD01011557.1.p1 GENE.GFUD01011557.1~~GFUD01011557.1.p1  ORF type:complete len:106 (-),score=20.30 GFUD01011557.1:138-455(-)